MEFPVKTGAPARQRTECAILPVFDDRQLHGATKDFDRAARGAITKLVRAGDAPLASRRRHDGPPHARHGRRSLAARRLRQAHRLHGQTAHDGARRRDQRAAQRRHQGSDELSRLRHRASRRPTPRATASRRRARACTVSTSSRAAPTRRRGSRVSASATRAARSANDVRAGIKIGTAIAAGSDLARDLGNRPANVCTPSHLAEAARNIAKRFARMEVKVLDEADMRRLGMGALLSRHARRRRAAATDRAAVPRRGREAGADRALRQGRHVRHGRHLDQAGAEDGRDEVRHVRRRRRARRDDRDRRAAAGAQRRRRHPGLREHAGRPRHASRRHRQEPVGANRRDHQHGRRRPAHPLRRDHLREALQAALHHRRRDADGRLRHRARPRLHGPVLQRRAAREARCSRPPIARSISPGGCRSTRSTASRCAATSRISRTPARATAAPASARTSCRDSSTACRGRTSTSPASPGARTRTKARRADPCRCSSTSCLNAGGQ